MPALIAYVVIWTAGIIASLAGVPLVALVPFMMLMGCLALRREASHIK